MHTFAAYYNSLRLTASHCNSLHLTASHCHCISLHLTASHCITATHCTALQLTATRVYVTCLQHVYNTWRSNTQIQLTTKHCKTLQNTATHVCNTWRSSTPTHFPALFHLIHVPHTHTQTTHTNTHTLSLPLSFSVSPSLRLSLTHSHACFLFSHSLTPLNEMTMFFWSLVTSAFFFLVSSEHFFPLFVSENLFYVVFPMFHQIFSRFGCISEENGVRYLSFRYLPLHINICKFI